MIKLIGRGESNVIRSARIGRIAGCGEVAVVVATGRAMCRQCGRRIAKGEEALATVYDFLGGGLAGDPWTGTEIKIHRVDCEVES